MSDGRADLAMLPVENSTYGRIADIHHLLPESGLHIIGEHFVRVHANLLALPGTKLEEVKTAMSQAPLLGQVRGLPASAHGDRGRWWAPTPRGRRRRSRRQGTRALAALASELAARDLRARGAGAARRGPAEQHHALPGDGARAAAGADRGGDDDLRLPGPQHPGGALQGDGRVRDQRRQHDQARELHGRRPVHRDAVLCRHRGASGRAAGGAGAGGAAPISPPSCRSSGSIRGAPFRATKPRRWRPRRSEPHGPAEVHGDSLGMRRLGPRLRISLLQEHAGLRSVNGARRPLPVSRGAGRAPAAG